MGTNDEIQNVNSDKTPVFPTSWKNRFTPFVCQWRALQNERALAATRLDCFSKEISEKLAAYFRPSSQTSEVASPFENLF
jgi:hypothetical protein